MRKYHLIILLIIMVSALILSGCNKEILTYDHFGVVVIEIKNTAINAEDVTVFVTDENANIEKSGKKITITFEKMLRQLITLSLDGYISKTVLVKSTDYNTECTYETDVTFEKDYIMMELTVITEAESEDIKLESEQLISYTMKGNVYDIKLSYAENPQINISAGDGYKSYKVTLNSQEIESGLSSRTVMILDDKYVMAEVVLDSDTYCYLYTESTRYINQLKFGNTVIYSIPTDKDARLTIYTIGMFEYIGEINLTVHDMAESDTFFYTMDDLEINIKLRLEPYEPHRIKDPRWYVIAEKTGEDAYIALAGESCYGSIQTWCKFKKKKEYYAFIMCGDGRIRYKEINIEDAVLVQHSGNRELEMTFTGEDLIREISVKAVDFNQEIVDFTGIKVLSDASIDNDLGTIESGDTLAVEPIQCYTIIRLDNPPSGYRNVDRYYKSLDFLARIAFEGVYEAEVYHYFDLEVIVNSLPSYQQAYIYCNSDMDTKFYLDENNKTTILDFGFDKYYYLVIDGIYRDFNSFINIDKITRDDGYKITVRFQNY